MIYYHFLQVKEAVYKIFACCNVSAVIYFVLIAKAENHGFIRG